MSVSSLRQRTILGGTPIFLLLFCYSDLGVILAEWEKMFSKAVEDKERWRKRPNQGEAIKTLCETEYEDKYCHSRKNPQSDEDEEKPLLLTISHKDHLTLIFH